MSDDDVDRDVRIIEQLSLAVVDGEGLCIVDEDGHYWHLFNDAKIRSKSDRLAAIYKNTVDV